MEETPLVPTAGSGPPPPVMAAAAPTPRPGFWDEAFEAVFRPVAAFSPERLRAMRHAGLMPLLMVPGSLAFGRLWSLGFSLLRGDSPGWAASGSGMAAELVGKPLLAAVLLSGALGVISRFLERGVWLVGLRREKGLSRRILARASTASLAALIPVVGVPLAICWALVLCWIGLRIGYEIGWFRLLVALAASLGMLALLLGLPFVLAFALFAPALTLLGRFPGF